MKKESKIILQIRQEISEIKDPSKAIILQRFFKTWKWEYAEGDIFCWMMVPSSRKLVDKYWSFANFDDIKILFDSPIHEERLIWILMLVKKYSKWDSIIKKLCFNFYLDNLKRVNNWDLVDLSAHKIIWDYILNYLEFDASILYKLSESMNLWERRVSIISTAAFISKGYFDVTIALSERLLKDKHDLMHKAVWWMLREVWKKDISVLRRFLDKHADEMPRTMLRYSIEKMDKDERYKYMNK